MNAPDEGRRPHICPATEDDYEAILAVWSAAGLGVRPQGRDARGPFRRQLAAFPDLYLVAKDEGRVVGVVLGTHDERKGWINRLAVVPAYRRRGIAAALVRACETALEARGIHIITALVEPASAASAELFAGLGYREDVPVRYFRKVSRAEW